MPDSINPISENTDASDASDLVDDVADHADDDADQQGTSSDGGSTPRGRRANIFAILACIAAVVSVIALSLHWGAIDFYSAAMPPVPAADDLAGISAEAHVMTAQEPRNEAAHQNMDDAAWTLSNELALDHLTVFDLRPIGFEFVSGELLELTTARRAARFAYRGKADSQMQGLRLSVVVPDRVTTEAHAGPQSPQGHTRWQWQTWEVRIGEVPLLVIQGFDGISVVFLVSDDPAVTELIAEYLARRRDRQ
jgi:hypothetical protein